MKPAAVVLAGGSGTRLGGVDKGLLRWKGEPFAVHLTRLLANVGPVALVTQTRQTRYAAPLRQAGLAVTVIHDPWDDLGPMAGLVAGLNWALEQGCDGVVVAPCDAPRLNEKWLSRLLDAAARSSNRVHVCEVDERLQPLHGWYPVSLAAELHAAVSAGERRVARWISAYDPQILPCSDLAEQFLNVNTPADRDQLES